MHHACMTGKVEVVAEKLSAFFSLRTITFLLIVMDGFYFLEQVPRTALTFGPMHVHIYTMSTSHLLLHKYGENYKIHHIYVIIGILILQLHMRYFILDTNDHRGMCLVVLAVAALQQAFSQFNFTKKNIGIRKQTATTYQKYFQTKHHC